MFWIHYAENKSRYKCLKNQIGGAKNNSDDNIADDNVVDDNVADDIQLLLNLEKENKDDKKSNLTLLKYQIPHANKLISILNTNKTALDASDPGTGKTYVAAFVAHTLKKKVIVITPKNVLSKWKEVLDSFNVEYLMIVNYELIARGKQYIHNKKVQSPYIDVIKKGKITNYNWKVDNDVLFIFDEAHRCKYLKTKSAKLLSSAKLTNNNILLLSATIIDKPTDFAIFAYVLNLSNSIKILVEWIKRLKAPTKTLHTLLYKGDSPKSSRLAIADLKGEFPDTQIIAETFTMKHWKRIKKEYDTMSQKIIEAKGRGENYRLIMLQMQHEFMRIETFKVPTFIELTKDYLENGFSVAIFVNYTATLELLAKEFKTKSIIRGGQKLEDRDNIIKNFQDDKTRIIICNIKAGGVGISLHDINGKYARVSLISPCYSSTNLVQVLGRIHRSGGKTKSLQRIIFAANTPEENIAKSLHVKLQNLSLLNDGDMETYYIDGLIHNEKEIMTNKLIKDFSERDLQKDIDSRLKRIEYKIGAFGTHMSDLFPKKINVISGVQNIYLLKGKGMFNGIEVLILGEDHSRNQKCRSCNRNCIEIIDLISYITYYLHPNIIDLYLEAPYYPSKTLTLTSNSYSNSSTEDKFHMDITKYDQTRISDIYAEYRHLLTRKEAHSENLRLHSVDIRKAAFTKINFQEGKLMYTFQVLYMFVYDIYYKISIIADENYKNGKVNINYDNNTQLYEWFATWLHHMKVILFDKSYKKYIDMILKCDNELTDAYFKINKQKHKFIEAYSDSGIIMIADNMTNFIKKMYDDRYDEAWKDLEQIKKYMQYIDSDLNDEELINNFLNSIFQNINTMYKRISFKSLADLIACYMDQYCVYRLLRKFDNNSQNNVVFYGGFYHAANILNILMSTNMFEIKCKMDETIMKNMIKSGEQDCMHMIGTSP